MKKLTLILCSFIAAFAAMAEEVTLVVVDLFDGSKELYNLPDKPKMRFEGDNLILESETMQGQYARTAVEQIRTEKGERQSSIAEVNAGFTFSYDGNTVKTSAESMVIFNINGTKLLEGKGTIDISGLSQGVYVVAPANHSAIKIVKK